MSQDAAVSGEIKFKVMDAKCMETQARHLATQPIIRVIKRVRAEVLGGLE